MTDSEWEAREKMAEFDRESAESAERWIERMGLEGDDAEHFRNHSRHWILIDGEPVAVGLYEWGKWFENTPRRLIGQEDVVGPDNKTYWVSTVFLGLDHSFGPSGPPLLFETMVFERHEPCVVEMLGIEYTSDKDEVYVRRYATLAQATAGHERAIQRVLSGNLDDDD
jgi:hypothetical protein